MDLSAKLKENALAINNQIEKLLNGREGILTPMRYSAIGSGKNLRSFLFSEILAALGESPNDYLHIAAAIELLHSYSLIHDDLPAMDDGKTRRGKKTLHLKFDEAKAILAGDALLTLAFEIISSTQSIDSETKVNLIRELGIAAGYKGMIEGQFLDISSSDKTPDLNVLNHIHYLKTGKLFKFCAIAPCFITSDLSKITLLEKFAFHFGLLFQITDDLLDALGDKEDTGKDVHKDAGLNKLNYVSVCGLSKTKEYASYHAAKAKAALNGLGAMSLEQLISYVLTRKN